ncbi:MAG: nucleotidyltransferase family protein [candidate division KSB1 bacterium]|nr:nucleotidyltransferase family protein [candidate division KSB1 bacterium]MDZ7365796.1 nucleotidyltransferase family protein [candidate division KSB1 bacterium]MDZ7403725.1 nucleotidyltransferase family protein [candidate division KSB1 bacterium]
MIQPQRIQQNLQSLKVEARKRYKAELKGIFGSFARGEAREDSDVDILVHFDASATLLDLVGLGNFLEEKLQRKVDVVTPAALRKEFRAQILRELVTL